MPSPFNQERRVCTTNDVRATGHLHIDKNEPTLFFIQKSTQNGS